MKKLTPMMRRATKMPAPDRAANTGLTWAFWALVRSGRVEGGTGIWPPIGAMVVEVVVVVGAGVAGAVGAVPKKYVPGEGETTGGREERGVVGGLVDGGTLGEVVGLGRVTVGTAWGSVVRGRVGWAVVAAAARSAGAEPAPSRTAASPAATAPASTGLTRMASRRCTPSIVAVVEPGIGTPSALRTVPGQQVAVGGLPGRRVGGGSGRLVRAGWAG
jgi:hypothetical protein